MLYYMKHIVFVYICELDSDLTALYSFKYLLFPLFRMYIESF